MGNTRVFTDPRSQYFKSDGVSVNSSGKIYFREPGSGSVTLKTVYSDKDLSVPLINPVILDSNGRAPEIFLSGDYNIQMTDSADVQIWRVDNYQPPTVEGQFSEWNSTLTYAVNDYVRYTDGNYYVSLLSGNTGNVPSSSPTYWSQAYFLTVYNSSTSYSIDEIVYYSGNIYTSRQNNNQGNTPDTSTDFWLKPGVSVPPVTGYIGQIVKYFRTENIDALSLDPIMSDNVWRSFGPTGSGADTIWTTLDDIPLNAVAISISIQMFAERTSGASDGYSLLFDSRTNGLTNNFEVAAIGDYGSSTEPSTSYTTQVFEVPLSSSNVFDMRYNETNTDSIILTARVVGFSVEEA